MSNERWQQEIQEAKEQEIFAALHRVQEACGDETALTVASTFGLSDQWRKHTKRSDERRTA